jgi:hypothetical protein
VGDAAAGVNENQKGPKQKLRQDLQDEQDGLPMREKSPKGERVFLMPIFFFIPSIL